MKKQEIKFTTKLEEIEEIAKKIGKNSKVKAIYLFGSYSTGRQHINSDIDLCVITERKEDFYEIDCWDSDNLDVSSFWELPISIKFRVFNDGKKLIINDKDFVYKVKIGVLKEYLDFIPRINRFVKEVLYV